MQATPGSDLPIEPGMKLRDNSYTVTERLAVGGHAVIYKALDPAGDTVILKEYQLTPGETLGVMVESARIFENESGILGRLECDQIVKMKDLFYQDHRVYLVLEHVSGPTLRQQVATQGPMDEMGVISVALQMCRILQFLHEQDPPIIHRDFTPDNLILEPNGNLKLIDFSVAQSGKNVKTGDCAGKHAYTPPEQFRGEPVVQSDIYALGATLFFLLSGSDPEPISVSHPLASDLNITQRLNDVIEHATALSLNDRYESVAWLSTELTGI